MANLGEVGDIEVSRLSDEDLAARELLEGLALARESSRAREFREENAADPILSALRTNENTISALEMAPKRPIERRPR